jgi:hypothetical protein
MSAGSLQTNGPRPSGIALCTPVLTAFLSQNEFLFRVCWQMITMESPHEALLLKNRVQLVEKIKLSSLLWVHLLQEKIVDDAVKQEIQVFNFYLINCQRN